MEGHWDEDGTEAALRGLRDAGLTVTVRDTRQTDNRRETAANTMMQRRCSASQRALETVSSGAQTCSPLERSQSHTLYEQNTPYQQPPVRNSSQSPPESPRNQTFDIHQLAEQLDELRATMFEHGCLSHGQCSPNCLRANSPVHSPSPPNRWPSPGPPNRWPSPPEMPTRMPTPETTSKRANKSPSEMPIKRPNPLEMQRGSLHSACRRQLPPVLPNRKSSPIETQNRRPGSPEMPSGPQQGPARRPSPPEIPTKQPRSVPVIDSPYYRSSINLDRGVSSSSHHHHRYHHRDLTRKEAFAESLRKYPNATERTFSAEVIQRLLTQLQHKNVPKRSLPTKRVCSLTRHLPDNGHRRSNKNIQTYTRQRDESAREALTNIYGRPERRRRVISPAKSERSDGSRSGHDVRSRSFSPRSTDVRYLSDVTRYVRDTLRQVCRNDGFQGPCPQLMDRYSEHRKEHHKVEDSTEPSAEKDQASCSKQYKPIKKFTGIENTIDCRGQHSLTMSNSVSLKMAGLKQKLCQICNQPRPCFCDLSPPCPCPQNRPTTIKDRLKNTGLIEELRRLYSQEPIYEACSCPQDVEDEVNNAVDEWLKLVPIYAGYSFKEKAYRDKIVEELKINLKQHLGNKASSIKDITTCLQGLPMWLPTDKSEQGKFKEKLTNDLMTMVLKIDIFANRVKKWVETLPFLTDRNIDKDQINQDMIRKFKDIAMTSKDLRNDIMNGASEVLDDLPITICSCLEKEDIAEKLANYICSLTPEIINYLKHMDDFSAVRKKLELVEKVGAWVNGVPVETTANIDRDAIAIALTAELEDIVNQTAPGDLWHATKQAALNKLDQMSVQGGNTETEIQASKLADVLTADMFGAIVLKWAKNVAFDHNSNISRDHFAFDLTKKLQAAIENVEPEDAEEQMKTVICDVLNSMPASGSLSLKVAQAAKLANALSRLGSKESSKIKRIVKKWTESLPVQSSEDTTRKVVNNLAKNIKHKTDTTVPQNLWFAIKQDILADIGSLEIDCNHSKKEGYAEKLADDIVEYLFEESIEAWVRGVPFKPGVESFDDELAKTIKTVVQDIASHEDFDRAADFIKSNLNESLPDELLECSPEEKANLIDGLVAIIRKSPKRIDKITLTIENWIKKRVPLTAPISQDRIDNFVKKVKLKLVTSSPQDTWKGIKAVACEELEKLPLDCLLTKLIALAEELASLLVSDEFEEIVKDWCINLKFDPTTSTENILPENLALDLANKLKDVIGDKHIDSVIDILQRVVMDELNELPVMYELAEKIREVEKLIEKLQNTSNDPDYILVIVEMWLQTVPFTPDSQVNKIRLTRELVGHLKHILKSAQPVDMWQKMKKVTINELSRFQVIGGPSKMESLAQSLAHMILAGMKENIIREGVFKLPYEDIKKVDRNKIAQQIRRNVEMILASPDPQLEITLKEAILANFENLPLICTVAQKSDLATELVEKLIAIPKEPDLFTDTIYDWVEKFPFESQPPVDRNKLSENLAMHLKNIVATTEPDRTREDMRNKISEEIEPFKLKCDDAERDKLLDSLADKLVIDLFSDTIRKWVSSIPLHPEPIVDRGDFSRRLNEKLKPKFHSNEPVKNDIINTTYNDLVKLPVNHGVAVKDVYLKELAQDLFDRLNKLPPEETEERKRKGHTYAINVNDWLKGVTVSLDPEDNENIIKTTLDKLRTLRGKGVEETSIKKELQQDIENSVNEILKDKKTDPNVKKNLAKKLCNEVFDTLKIIGEERKNELIPNYKKSIKEWLSETDEIKLDSKTYDKFSQDLAEKLAEEGIRGGTKQKIVDKQMQLIGNALDTVNNKFKNDSNLKNTLTEKLIHKTNAFTDFVPGEGKRGKKENIYRVEAIQTCTSGSQFENQLPKKSSQTQKSTDSREDSLEEIVKNETSLKTKKMFCSRMNDDSDLVEDMFSSFDESVHLIHEVNRNKIKVPQFVKNCVSDKNENKTGKRTAFKTGDKIEYKGQKLNTKMIKRLTNEFFDKLSNSSLSNAYESEIYMAKIIKKYVDEINNFDFNRRYTDSLNSSSCSVSISEQESEDIQLKKIRKHVTDWIKSYPQVFDDTLAMKKEIENFIEAMIKIFVKFDSKSICKRETEKKLRNAVLDRLGYVLDCKSEPLDSETKCKLVNQLVQRLVKSVANNKNNQNRTKVGNNYYISSPKNTKEEIKKWINLIPELSCSNLAEKKQMAKVIKALTKELSSIVPRDLNDDKERLIILHKIKDKLDIALHIVGQRLNTKTKLKTAKQLLDRLTIPVSNLELYSPYMLDEGELKAAVVEDVEEWMENVPELPLRTVENHFFTTNLIKNLVDSLITLKSQRLEEKFIKIEITSKICDQLNNIYETVDKTINASNISKLADDLSNKLIKTLNQLQSSSKGDLTSIQKDILEDSNKISLKEHTTNEGASALTSKDSKMKDVVDMSQIRTRNSSMALLKHNVIQKWFSDIKELQITNSNEKRKVKRWLGELTRKLAFLLSQNLDNRDLRSKMASQIRRKLELAIRQKGTSLGTKTIEALVDKLIDQITENSKSHNESATSLIVNDTESRKNANLFRNILPELGADIPFNTKVFKRFSKTQLSYNEDSNDISYSVNNSITNCCEQSFECPTPITRNKFMGKFIPCSSKVFYVEESTEETTKVSKEIDPETQEKIFRLVTHNIDAVETPKERGILKMQIIKILQKDVDLPENEAAALSESILKYAEEQAKDAGVDRKNLMALLRQEIRRIMADYPIDENNRDGVEAMLMDMEVGRLFEGKSYDDVKDKIFELLKKKGGLSDKDAVAMLDRLGGDYDHLLQSPSVKQSLMRMRTGVEETSDNVSFEKKAEAILKEFYDKNVNSPTLEKKDKINAVVDETIKNLGEIIEDPNNDVQDCIALMRAELNNQLRRISLDTTESITRLAENVLDQIKEAHVKTASSGRGMLQIQELKYATALENVIDYWLDTLPVDSDILNDIKRKKDIIKKLAGDVLNREKYLQQNPSFTTSEDRERQHLKKKCLEWIPTFLSGDDVMTASSQVDNLIDAIRGITVPKLVFDREEEYLDALESEIIRWASHLPEDINLTVDDNVMKQLVKDLAKTIQNAKGKSDAENSIRSAIGHTLPLMYEDLDEVKLERLKSSLFNTLLKSGFTDDTWEPNQDNSEAKRAKERRRSSQVLKYSCGLENAIGNWLDKLPIDENVLADKKFRDTIIRDLAGDLMDREKYLQENPSERPTEDQERDLVKSKCHIWMKKFLDGDNLKTAIAQTDDLIEAIRGVPVPKLIDNIEDSTQGTDQLSNAFIENTLNWLKQSPMYLKASPEDKKHMESAAIEMAKGLSKTIAAAKRTPGSDTEKMLRDEVKKHLKNVITDPNSKNDETVLNATADSLLNYLKGQKDFQELSGLPAMPPIDLLAQAVDAWTRTLPLEPNSPREIEQLEAAKKNLVSRLRQAREQFGPSIPEHDQAIKDEARKFLRSNITDPLKRTDNLYIEEQVNKLVKILNQVPIEKTNAKSSIKPYKSPADTLFEYIGEWVNNLPVQGEEEKVSLMKQNLTSKLINKIGEINMNPDIFNDHELYQDTLSDEIDKLLLEVPENSELNKYLPALKKELIFKVMDARQKMLDELVGKLYKQQLRDQISSSLPLPGPLALDEQASLELLKDKVADAFINLHYAGCDETEMMNYKKNISNEINRFCADIIRHYPCASLPVDELKTNLHEALQSVPVPRDDSMKSEVEQVRIRNLINDWMREIPLRQETQIEKLRRFKLAAVLAKNIHRAEMEKQYNDFIDTEPKIREEIKRFTSKIPIRQDSEHFIPAMIEKLLYILLGTEKSRKFISSPIRCQSMKINDTSIPFSCTLNKSKQKKCKNESCKSALTITTWADSSCQTDRRSSNPCAGFKTKQKSCTATPHIKDATCMTQKVPCHVTPRVVVKEYVWGSPDSCSPFHLQGNCLGTQTLSPQLESTKNSAREQTVGTESDYFGVPPDITPPLQCMHTNPCGRYSPSPCQQFSLPQHNTQTGPCQHCLLSGQRNRPSQIGMNPYDQYGISASQQGIQTSPQAPYNLNAGLQNSPAGVQANSYELNPMSGQGISSQRYGPYNSFSSSPQGPYDPNSGLNPLEQGIQATLYDPNLMSRQGSLPKQQGSQTNYCPYSAVSGQQLGPEASFCHSRPYRQERPSQSTLNRAKGYWCCPNEQTSSKRPQPCPADEASSDECPSSLSRYTHYRTYDSCGPCNKRKKLRPKKSRSKTKFPDQGTGKCTCKARVWVSCKGRSNRFVDICQACGIACPHNKLFN